MAEMKTFNGYEIVDGWAREQIKHINGAANEPTDGKYFDVDASGVLSLKEQYRFGGSEMYNLPTHIVIPEAINGVAVKGLAEGMFQENLVVEEIVFPSTVTTIPANCCYCARALKSIKNTEHITEIGEAAFMKSPIEKALFPSLTTAGIDVFRQCSYLREADIGNVTEIPENFFRSTHTVEVVNGGNAITQIGAYAFALTYSLRKLPFLGKKDPNTKKPYVQKVDDFAFLKSGLEYDWSKLTNCNFGTYATPIMDLNGGTENQPDYWSRTIGNHFYTPCENRLVTLLHQKHPLWKDAPVLNLGNGYTYGEKGCGPLIGMLIHSALTGKKYNTPQEYEAELGQIPHPTESGKTLLDINRREISGTKDLLKALGHRTALYADGITEDVFQNVLKMLKNGAYVYISVSTEDDINGGHADMAYGINERGELMFVDTLPQTHHAYRYDEGFTFAMPLQNMTGPNSKVLIVWDA